MTAPAYGVLRRVSDTASVLLENNPEGLAKAVKVIDKLV